MIWWDWWQWFWGQCFIWFGFVFYLSMPTELQATNLPNVSEYLLPPGFVLFITVQPINDNFLYILLWKCILIEIWSQKVVGCYAILKFQSLVHYHQTNFTNMMIMRSRNWCPVVSHADEIYSIFVLALSVINIIQYYAASFKWCQSSQALSAISRNRMTNTE